MSLRPKILVYVSSAVRVPHREGAGHDVGVFLGELVEPLRPLHEAGYCLDFVSPDGRGCTIDPVSYNMSYWGFSKKRLQRAKEFLSLLDGVGMRSPRKLSDVLSDKVLIDSYAALFVPGGHAPMTDILHKNWMESSEYNTSTGELLTHFHRNNKTTALICHATSVLAAAPDVDGQWMYRGYRMTCISMLAEAINENIPFRNTGGHLPDYPVRILERKGAVIRNVMLGNSLVIEDRELITAQDPLSARELGKRLLAKIKNNPKQTIGGSR